MQEILINNAVHETRVAVLEDGVLQELRIERNADVSLIGNIYLGVVGKVLPGRPIRKTEERCPSSGSFMTAKSFSYRWPKIRSEQKAPVSQPKSA